MTTTNVTATMIAKPSSHDVDLLSASIIMCSIVEAMPATINTLWINSSVIASQHNLQNDKGFIFNFSLFPY